MTISCCHSGVCVLLGSSPDSAPRGRVEKLVRRALPHLAASRLDISQLGPPQHASTSSTEAAFRVDVDGGKEVFFARLAREQSRSDRCQASWMAWRWGYVPLHKREHDAAHMRQLLSSVGVSPKAVKAEGQLIVDQFKEGGSLDPRGICVWPELHWTRLGKLLSVIHCCCQDGFAVKESMWPDRMRCLAAQVHQSGGVPPMHEIRDVASLWPTSGVAAGLVPGHGDFAGRSILKSDDCLLATDLEFSGINYAGIDVSYLFFQALFAQGRCEPVMSGAEPKWNTYPSLRHRVEFAKAYLEGIGHTGVDPHAFLLEVERFAPAVGLWAGMSLSRNPATRRGSTWYLSGYQAACRALEQADRTRILNEGVWAVAFATS